MNNFALIKRTSPLHDYWQSEQNDLDERQRLLKINHESKAKYLFEKEPYKWENLYQSIIREVLKGDEGSINGLKVLLDTVSSTEREKIFKSYRDVNLFDEDVIENLLNKRKKNKNKTKRNFLRFIRILFSIFFNPYRIDIKRKCNHIYEKTGYLSNRLLMLFD